MCGCNLLGFDIEPQRNNAGTCSGQVSLNDQCIRICIVQLCIALIRPAQLNVSNVYF